MRISGKSDIVTVTLDRLHTTYHDEDVTNPKAYLLTDGDNESWCPASMVEDHRDGTYSMPHWMAKKKGWL